MLRETEDSGVEKEEGSAGMLQLGRFLGVTPELNSAYLPRLAFSDRWILYIISRYVQS